MKLLRVFAAICAWLLVAPSAASACSCAMLSLTDKASMAGLIAEVRVTEIRAVGTNGSALPTTIYSVMATRVWKGPVESTYEIASASNGASCGLEGVTVGQRLLLFAQRTDTMLPSLSGSTPWAASLCGGTGPLTEQAAADVTKLLGSPRVAVAVVTAGSVGTPTSERPSPLLEPTPLAGGPVTSTVDVPGILRPASFLAAVAVGIAVLIAIGRRRRP